MMNLNSYFDKGFYILDKSRDKLLRWAVVVGLILASAGLGKLATRDIRLINIALVGMIAVLAGIVVYKAGRFEYSMLALIPVAAAMNFLKLRASGESQIAGSMMLTMVLIGFWFVQLLAPGDRSRLKPSALNLPVLLFIAINVVSLFWANLLRDPLVKIWATFPLVQLAALAVNILLPLLALLVFNKIHDVKMLRWLVGLMLAAGTFVIVAILFDLDLFRYYEHGHRGLFPTWVGLFAYGLVLFHRRLPWWLKLPLIVLLAGWVYHAFLLNTAWLSGWLPLAFGCGILTFLYSKRLTLALLLIAVAVMVTNYGWFYEHIYVANVQEGSNRRPDLWEKNLRLVSRHPLLGVGPAGYAPYYRTYHPEDARSTHNNYFDVLGQTGLIGFAVFLWIWGAALRAANRTRLALKGRGGFTETYANVALAGILAAVFAMMLGDWTLPFAYNQGIIGFDNAVYTWIFTGGLFSLQHIISTTKTQR
jgi:O-antigen ligase